MGEGRPYLQATRHYKRALVGRYRTARLDLMLGLIAIRERRLLLRARRFYARAHKQLDRPLVSVTIPTYNRGQLLSERTLPSVLNQTYQNFEIVIVGDCCTDDTEQRIARLGDPRIRFHNLLERGKYPDDPYHRWMVAGSVPINKALTLAQGEWIAHLDDDDVFTPGHIEVLLEFAMAGDYELAFGRYRYEQPPGAWTEIGGRTFPSGHPLVHGGGGVVPHSAVMYRSYLRFFRYYQESWRYALPTDYLMWQRMGRAGVRAGFLNQVVGLAPLRPGETMITPVTIRHAQT